MSTWSEDYKSSIEMMTLAVNYLSGNVTKDVSDVAFECFGVRPDDAQWLTLKATIDFYVAAMRYTDTLKRHTNRDFRG